jgi:hypothetical protein
MFQEDQTLVRRIVREEIAAALAVFKASMPVKPVVKLETPKPVEAEVKVEAEAPKKGK